MLKVGMQSRVNKAKILGSLQQLWQIHSCCFFERSKRMDLEEQEKMQQLEDRIVALEDRLNQIFYNNDTEIRLNGIVKSENWQCPKPGYKLDIATGTFVYIGEPMTPKKISWLSKLFGGPVE